MGGTGGATDGGPCIPNVPPPGCNCGVFGDGCGGQINCGTCMPGQMCTNFVCGGTFPPPRLALAGVFPDHVDLAWTVPTPNVTGFVLQRSINMGVIQSIPIAGQVTHFSDFGVTQGFVLYTLLATDSSGNSSPPSNTVSTSLPFPASAWRTSGADIEHSGFNSVETARPPGTLAWTLRLDGGIAAGVAIDPPREYVTAIGTSTASLIALDSDGGTAWAAGFPGFTSISHPSVFDGRVFVNLSSPMAGEIAAYDFSGTQSWTAQTAVFASGPIPAPVFTGDTVVANAAGAGLLVELAEGNGMQVRGMSITQADPWVPTLSGGQLWITAGPQVTAFDLFSLAPAASFPYAPPSGLSDEWASATSGLIVSAGGPTLFANNATMSIWTTTGMSSYVAPPAIAQGFVFAVTADQIEVHDEMSGMWLASLPTDGGLSFPPAVAAGVVYASSPTTVFAFDVMTRQLLWTATPGGRLSIAQGTLYVAGGDTVRAYSLTP
jgi:hypothetical protein